MLKNIAIALFIIIFSIFALDYFKLLPTDRQLAFNNITRNQEHEINSFSAVEKPQQSSKFTDRIANKNNSL
jgi:hypothetical protein|tara:strand:+ start:100 stop:312 length:213 start_codon:yes stop_codon:yes gene_type:complete